MLLSRSLPLPAGWALWDLGGDCWLGRCWATRSWRCRLHLSLRQLAPASGTPRSAYATETLPEPEFCYFRALNVLTNSAVRSI